MKVLVACEFSGVVRDAFAKLGHDAWSCDLLPTERPGQHIQGDVLGILDKGWDLMIAHPPCTHLAVSGARYFKAKQADGRQQQGIDFFMAFVRDDIAKWCIENPIGIMSRIYRKPDQIIQPYYYGHPQSKSTCLWLKGLPKLVPTNIVDSGGWSEWVDKRTGKKKRESKWIKDVRGLPPQERMKIRSKTFQGIADAMAEQWGNQRGV
jgi:hypothetical protein